MNYIVYNDSGVILRTGWCSLKTFYLQAGKDKDGNDLRVMEGEANDAKQKVVDGKVIDKSPEELEVAKVPEMPEIPSEKLPAYITNEQWQDMLKRLKKLEKNKK